MQKNEYLENFESVKQASYQTIDDNTRRLTLIFLSELLRDNYQKIIQANEKDLSACARNDPKYDRLKLDKERILSIAIDVAKIANLPFVVNQVLENKVLANGLELKKQRVPLGVVAAIYESRPNVTIDIFCLCFKAGNACILKGGKEAHHSNQILYNLITQSLDKFGLNQDLVYLMPPDRSAIYDLLNATDIINVCIPRGSKQLIDFVRQNAKVPVIETGAGVVHTYFDSSGDLALGKLIIHNAKTRRVSVCNALDTLIIHKERLAQLPDLVMQLKEQQVEIFADADSYAVLQRVYPANLLFRASAADFGLEFLGYKMSIKTVESFAQALLHIRKYSSQHSEAIIAEDQRTIENFFALVDAAVVYANASTAFTDGGEFGMTAEVGISTQKLHARGPMGLEALTSYKWLIYGTGQIRK